MTSWASGPSKVKQLLDGGARHAGLLSQGLPSGVCERDGGGGLPSGQSPDRPGSTHHEHLKAIAHAQRDDSNGGGAQRAQLFSPAFFCS